MEKSCSWGGTSGKLARRLGWEDGRPGQGGDGNDGEWGTAGRGRNLRRTGMQGVLSSWEDGRPGQGGDDNAGKRRTAGRGRNLRRTGMQGVLSFAGMRLSVPDCCSACGEEVSFSLLPYPFSSGTVSGIYSADFQQRFKYCLKP